MDARKEEQFFRKHMIELARNAYHREHCIYTDFLNINEISIFHSMGQDLPEIPFSLWGGFLGAERQKICFHGDLDGIKKDVSGSDFQNPDAYPISCLHIQPGNEKFAEELSHRDYLGAILNLSIDRGKVGDILVRDKEAFVFCDSTICTYIMQNLEKIRHTKIKISLKNLEDMEVQPEYITIKGSVMSIRLDSVISVAFNTSRSSISDYIAGEKVFVNGKLTVSLSYPLEEGDIVSVRGLGKFIYESKGQLTKKGRTSITILKYN